MKLIKNLLRKIFSKKELETKTNRWFSLYCFKDKYWNKCSLQKSSLATEDCVWLWVDNNRMHLTQKQVRKLIQKLNRFADKWEF